MHVHDQIPNFSELKKWVITPESKGTVYLDGKATAQPVFNGNGKYYLYIADNLKTERENTQYMYCYFFIINNSFGTQTRPVVGNLFASNDSYNHRYISTKYLFTEKSCRESVKNSSALLKWREICH